MGNPEFFILYMGPKDRAGRLELGDMGWKVAACQGPEALPALTRRPDMVLMDPFSQAPGEPGMALAQNWLEQIAGLSLKHPPPVFAVLPGGAGAKERMDLMAAGFDDALDWPVSGRLLGLLARPHQKNIRICQDLDVCRESLGRSFDYLDRFKTDLGKTKTELAEERNSLNAALKQVQQMTLERRRLKAGEAALKQSLTENMKGVGGILHDLIQHRVEKNRGHAQRVAKISEFIGREMGLDEKKLDDLRKAAMLHEIGLLFLTTGRCRACSLEEGEGGRGQADDAWEMAVGEIEDGPAAYDRTLMAQYPVKGAQLLGHCPGFEAPARIIRSLNENADGTGFPEGVRRRYIPLASKILAGADELEALRERPDITGTDALLTALEQLAGGRLDPVIVGWLEKYVVLHLGPEDFRVRGLGIEQLEPGMILATALFTASGTKLFVANTALTRESIEKILQYHREYPVDATVYIKV